MGAQHCLCVYAKAALNQAGVSTILCSLPQHAGHTQRSQAGRQPGRSGAALVRGGKQQLSHLTTCNFIDLRCSSKKNSLMEGRPAGAPPQRWRGGQGEREGAWCAKSSTRGWAGGGKKEINGMPHAQACVLRPATNSLICCLLCGAQGAPGVGGHPREGSVVSSQGAGECIPINRVGKDSKGQVCVLIKETPLVKTGGGGGGGGEGRYPRWAIKSHRGGGGISKPGAASGGSHLQQNKEGGAPGCAC